MADRRRAEHQHPPADVEGDVVAVAQQFLEDVGIICVERQHFLPGPLVENQLQGPYTFFTRLLRDPAELVVGEMADTDAVIGDRLGYVGGAS